MGRRGYTCKSCGEQHDDAPTSFHAHAPAFWSDDLTKDGISELSEDQCVIRDETFFVRGLIRIPIHGQNDSFEWGVWVSLSLANFVRTQELWNTPGRESEPPMFGWLSTELSAFYEASTLSLKTMVHTQSVGHRPLVVLEPTDHPLAIEQRSGISLDRVQAIFDRVLHGGAA